ncbi:hypothetical protein LLH06_03515 [Mucilaginibacter daejeonensis]|uniref:hypothetical protein n=1 Tax=Mucilaginibacter daejeonensis TaxID=398049 RepID=UPI001D178A71|nr:hypothetical protein [Mucilaginibacter daejeonensis]UEG54039.1 hypothetical protein LLH06_03515 [Mucilaginibacter daejeonensis]
MKTTILDYYVFKQDEADVREVNYSYSVLEDSGEQWEGYASFVVSGSLLIDWSNHFKSKYNEMGLR